MRRLDGGQDSSFPSRFFASTRLSTTSAGDGIVTAAAACWRFECGIAKEHDENQLLRISVPAGDHTSGDIWLYLRFTLSFCDVEDLLAERGIAVSYETVRRWVNHFGPMIAAHQRKRRPKPHATWHLDEVCLKIDGRMGYLWRAVDAEGEVLDVLVHPSATSTPL